MKMLTKIRFAALALLVSIAPACAVEDGEREDQVSEVASEVTGIPTFDIWKSSDKYYFHFEAANGEIVLGSQGYSTQLGAIKGVLSVRANGTIASRYSTTQGIDGDWYIKLKTAAGTTIATGEGYSTKSNALAGITAIVSGLGTYLNYWANITGARYEVKQGATGKFSFNLRASNGRVVLSSESYDTQASAFNGAFAVQNYGDAISNYTVKQAIDGKWYFTLKNSANGQIIGKSQMYTTKSSAQTARDAVRTLIASEAADIL